MTIQVALYHKTSYTFDRPVALSPHEVRLRPAAHCRTPILSYSLRVSPAKHFVNWQQDGYGNYMARFVFPEPARELIVEVDLVAEMTVINPFDFFIEQARRAVSVRLHRRAERRARAIPGSGASGAAAERLDRAGEASAVERQSDEYRGPAGCAQCASAARHSVHRANGAGRLQIRKKRCRWGAARAATAAGCWCRFCGIWASRHVSSPAI